MAKGNHHGQPLSKAEPTEAIDWQAIKDKLKKADLTALFTFLASLLDEKKAEDGMKVAAPGHCDVDCCDAHRELIKSAADCWAAHCGCP